MLPILILGVGDAVFSAAHKLRTDRYSTFLILFHSHSSNGVSERLRSIWTTYYIDNWFSVRHRMRIVPRLDTSTRFELRISMYPESEKKSIHDSSKYWQCSQSLCNAKLAPFISSLLKGIQQSSIHHLTYWQTLYMLSCEDLSKIAKECQPDNNLVVLLSIPCSLIFALRPHTSSLSSLWSSAYIPRNYFLTSSNWTSFSHRTTSMA